jgi:gluconolactonase
VPQALRRDDAACPWAEQVLDRDSIGSFLEGPVVDRDGQLLVSDLAHGRILRVNEQGEVSEWLGYDGVPNGLALHPNGSLFIADYRHGLLARDPDGELRTVLESYRYERFRGLSDLVFDAAGTLYFSDQGQSDLRFPTGRLFRWHPSDGLELLMDAIPSPNGVGLSPDGTTLYVAVTRANCVYRLPIRRDGAIGKVGVHLYLAGGSGGPDGLAVDASGGLAVAEFGRGRVLLFDSLGTLTGTVDLSAGLGTTNVAFGGVNWETVYITEALSGTIATAPAPRAGLAPYSHR